MIEQSQPYREDHTLITADAGYHSDSNIAQPQQHNIPAMVADNQMRSRDERFADQDKYKGKPGPLAKKTATGQPKEVKRFGPKDFEFNDDNTATCPAGKRMASLGTMRQAIDSPQGRQLYSQRIGTVEPVFANIRHNKRLTRLNHRGRAKVNRQWNLYCMVHNIEKLSKTNLGCQRVQ